MKEVVLSPALFVTLTLLTLFPHGAPQAQDRNKQRQYLEQMLRLFPESKPWQEWLDRTGELPPDFDQLSGVPFLPNPLQFADGKNVGSAKEWPRRRQELLGLFQHYVIGTVPPAPVNVQVAEKKTREEAGARVQEITLEFGPAHRAKLFMELIIPKGEGPFPVFITQHNHRRWALVAVSRGYVACVYAGADSRDDSGAFVSIWPEYDWTKLTRRAWASSRCIDYLYTLPFVDRSRIALTGHSRNGKTSIIAGALDERISAIISSSSGAGGACTYRLFSETQFGEGIELITRRFPDWLHPRLRFFAGRENKLPIDQHELIACIAPRPFLLSTALNDPVESVWAIEQTYYSAKQVYSLLGEADHLNLRYRSGAHETRAEDIEAYLDWLDTKFDRSNYRVNGEPIFPTYSDWLAVGKEKIEPTRFPEKGMDDLLITSAGRQIRTVDAWKEKKEDVRRRMEWGLGDAPAHGRSAGGSYGSERNHMATMLRRFSFPEDLEKHSLNFGNYIAGDLYYPAGADQSGRKMPAVVWLHPISNSNGYVPGYRRGEYPHIALARAGFAVFAFDQIGNGSRLQEVKNFYRRHPHWSLLGKTIRDTRAAVDALGNIDFIDPHRIYLLGYATGGMAALHTGALDGRIAGVVSVAGFTPMRLDTAEKGTGGIERWARWLPLQPRLGAFVGQERRLPYDYHEVLAMLAPRPLLVVSPRIDYQNNLNDVQRCLTEVEKVYELFGEKEQLRFYEVDDYNRFSPELQQQVYERFRQMVDLPRR
ncbi:MAG: alpha/beta fold hydrolase [Acidobacteriota bacterium]